LKEVKELKILSLFKTDRKSVKSGRMVEKKDAGVAQLIERCLAKAKVAGLNPVSRSKLLKSLYNSKVKVDRENPKFPKTDIKSQKKSPQKIELSRKAKRISHHKSQGPSLYSISPDWAGVEPSLAWAIPVMKAVRSEQALKKIQERDERVSLKIALEKKQETKKLLKIV
jgi:hypothetical protein